MNLENLISLYLDGELTSAQDVELRNLIREDAAAKQEFDAAVEIFMAVKEDRKSIQAPAKFLANVEENIMMSMIAASPISLDSPQPIPMKRKRSPLYSYMMAAAIAAFMIFGYRQIGDLFNTFSPQDDLEQMARSQEQLSVYEQAIPLAESKAERKTISDNELITVSQIESDDIPISSGSLAEDDDRFNQTQSAIAEFSTPASEINPSKEHIIRNETFSQMDRLPVSKPFTSDMDDAHIISAPSVKESVSSSLDNSGGSIIHSIREESSRGMPREMMSQSLPTLNDSKLSIRLGSFMSSGFGNTGFSGELNSAIKNVSQSISYAFDEESNFGLEIGYTQFDYNTTVNKSLPTSVNPISSATEIPSGEDDLSFIKVPISVSRQLNSYWGVVFYERQLYSYENLNLTGRLALGSSLEGPLGYSRVIAEYRIFDILSLNAGLEGRMYGMQINGLTSEKSMTSAYSLIYGIQFSF